jgi:hypothetical protein
MQLLIKLFVNFPFEILEGLVVTIAIAHLVNGGKVLFILLLVLGIVLFPALNPRLEKRGSDLFGQLAGSLPRQAKVRGVWSILSLVQLPLKIQGAFAFELNVFLLLRSMRVDVALEAEILGFLIGGVSLLVQELLVVIVKSIFLGFLFKLS